MSIDAIIDRYLKRDEELENEGKRGAYTVTGYSSEAEADLAALIDLYRAQEIDLAKAQLFVNQVNELLTAYHTALDKRQHGGVAAAKLVEGLESITGRPWLRR